MSNEAQQPVAVRRVKRKVALIFGYVGAKYYGLQNNFDETHPTIEAILIAALGKTDFISEMNMVGETMKKIGWQRASRTDKGVSALRNVANATLMVPTAAEKTEDPNAKKAQEENGVSPTEVQDAILLKKEIVRLNEALPADIHVYTIIGTTTSFNSYLACTGRRYQYLLPTFALLTPELYKEYFPEEYAGSLRTYGSSVGAKRSREEEYDGQAEAESKKEDEELSPEEEARRAEEREKIVKLSEIQREVQMPPDHLAKIRNHRISEKQLESARLLFSLFVGTNWYHNFTPSGEGKDMSCSRFITEVTVSDPMLVKQEEIQFANANPGEVTSSGEEANTSKKEEKGVASASSSSSSSSSTQIECVRVQLDGQSFLLNQIRKIIGAVVGVMCSGSDGGFIRQAFDRNVKRHIPLAPANGLYLDSLHFTKYNLQLDRIQNAGNNASNKKRMDPTALATAEETEMVQQWICKSIGNQEIAEETFLQWMRNLRSIIGHAWSKEM